MKDDGRTRRVLELGEVHVWHADLDGHLDRARLLEYLCSPDERRRAEELRDERRRSRFVARKGLMRVLIADYAQRAGATDTLLSSTAYASGAALFALARTERLGLGIAPVRPHAAPPPGVLSAEEALWFSRASDRGRATALIVAAREAAGRARHDRAHRSIATALRALGSGLGPVDLGDELILQVVRADSVVGCVVHDGEPAACPVRRLSV